MLHEYKDLVSDIKVKDAHFAKIFERHNELDKRINDAESGREHIEALELDTLKKEKLRLKDEAYAIVLEYKKEHNL